MSKKNNSNIIPISTHKNYVDKSNRSQFEWFVFHIENLLEGLHPSEDLNRVFSVIKEYYFDRGNKNQIFMYKKEVNKARFEFASYRYRNIDPTVDTDQDMMDYIDPLIVFLENQKNTLETRFKYFIFAYLNMKGVYIYE